VAFSPDGKRIASASDDGTVKLWDAEAGQEAALAINTRAPLLAVAFSPEGTRLAAAGDKSLTVYDTASGQAIRHLRRQPRISYVEDYGVHSAAFSPDGRQLAAEGANKTVWVWDVQTGKRIRALTEPRYRVYAVAFSADGKWLAAASEDKKVHVWDAADGREVRTLEHAAQARMVAFSPDSKRLASAGMDPTIKVWDAQDGQLLMSLTGHRGPVAALAFSAAGDRLASAGADKTVRIWDAADGRHLLTLEGHTDWVTSVAFSPDGQRLASASADRTVKLWDTTSGQETLTQKGDGLMMSVAFSPDGQQLAAAGFDRRVRLWDTRPWEPRRRIEHQARSLLRRLYGRFGIWSEVRQHVRADDRLAAPLRQEAIAMAERCVDDVVSLNSESWEVAVRPDAAPEHYARAVRQARTICRLEPADGNYLNTLGVALYRAGSWEEAAETLARSGKMNAAQRSGRFPSDAAFLAMSQFKLGRLTDAQASLAELRQLMKLPVWAGDAESLAFLREASDLIEGRR
jgi:WD40 repeat protein